MTPYVEVQEAVISVLHRMWEKDPTLLKPFKKETRRGIPVPQAKREMMRVLRLEGLSLYAQNLLNDVRMRNEINILDILEEQIDESGPTILIKNILGSKLYNYGKPIGFAEYLKLRGSGSGPGLRTDRLAQPSALMEGDTLATGDKVLFEPREGGNGSVLLKLSGGTYGHWISVPARIPIALLTPEDEVPEGYIQE